MYLYSVLPSSSFPLITGFSACLNTLWFSSGLVAKFTYLPTHQLMDPFPRTLRHATLELASNNLICSVALTGVLALQAGRFWAESSDNDEDVYEDAEVDGTRSRAKTPDLRSEKPQVHQRIKTNS
jgi:hypothetical protein